ncbi:MAG: hypothetical protein V8R94_09470 [Lachnospiraceae bacterium]
MKTTGIFSNSSSVITKYTQTGGSFKNQHMLQEGKWNCNKPHKEGIYDHSKSGITATPEAAAYKAGIDAFSHKAPGCHNYKSAKIINGRLCQFIPIEIQYQSLPTKKAAHQGIM